MKFAVFIAIGLALLLIGCDEGPIERSLAGYYYDCLAMKDADRALSDSCVKIFWKRKHGHWPYPPYAPAK